MDVRQERSWAGQAAVSRAASVSSLGRRHRAGARIVNLYRTRGWKAVSRSGPQENSRHGRHPDRPSSASSRASAGR